MGIIRTTQRLAFDLYTKFHASEVLRLSSLLRRDQYFPTVIMALNVGAAVMSFQSGDYKRAIYWLAAAVLTWSVTF